MAQVIEEDRTLTCRDKCGHIIELLDKALIETNEILAPPTKDGKNEAAKSGTLGELTDMLDTIESLACTVLDACSIIHQRI